MKKLLNGFIILMVTTAGCKEKYIPSLTYPPTGYLVVEGFINSGLEPTSIKLTRTSSLADNVNTLYEHNAEVNIEGENNEIFPLYESGEGTYTSSFLQLNDNVKYHLHIKTSDAKEYMSDFAPIKHTPDIDSVSFQRENTGVRIYVNTHDPLNNTKYYQWKYEETWEIHSAFLTNLKYTYDPITFKIKGVAYKDLNPDTTIYKCWPSTVSTNINLGSSEKLSADVIYLPLVFIENADDKLSVRYSINVKQYALSHEAYLFFNKIKKNSEELGSIFDPQPSELQGNIHCITNPAETVIGYVEISEEKQKRRFIENAEVPGWNYRNACQLVTIVNQADSINKYASTLSPVMPVTVAQRSIVEFSASNVSCIDCTLRATNVRPPFWP